MNAELFLSRGIPTHIRSDNGPEFIASKLRQWLNALQVAPLSIEPGSPWENGYCESFNGKMRDQLCNAELFYTLRESSSNDGGFITTRFVHIAVSGGSHLRPIPSSLRAED